MRSTFGVVASLLPKHEKSPQPMSSMKTMMKFGGAPARDEAVRAKNNNKAFMVWRESGGRHDR